MTPALAIQQKEHYTYADYLTWDDDIRCELIDGVLYSMSPAPKPFHQEILGVLHSHFFHYLKGKKCKVYLGPFDVRLDADTDDDTVVQPDLSVICDKSKIDDKGCKGAPDLVVEILSPSTSSKDLVEKFHKYLESGVKEYWVVNPESKVVTVYLFTGDVHTFRVFDATDTVTSDILEGLKINLSEVFEQS